MAKTDTKLAYAMIDWYIKQFAIKYGYACTVNKHREKWAMIDLIESVGYDRGKQLIEYYFKTTSNNKHSLSWFMYNFDRLDDMLKKIEKDTERRAKILAATKQMVEGQ